MGLDAGHRSGNLLDPRPGAEIAVALGVAVIYLLAAMRMALPAERSHLIEYSVVAVFIYEALTDRASQGRRVPVPALLAVLATSLVGVIDECIQFFLPSRVFDPVDMLANVLAAVLAITASAALGWARRLALQQFRRHRTYQAFCGDLLLQVIGDVGIEHAPRTSILAVSNRMPSVEPVTRMT